MKQVVPMFFSYFVLILASSRIDEIETSNRERSLTETSYNRYPKSEIIPIKRASSDGMAHSHSLDFRNMGFSPYGRNKGISPISDPEFYKNYFGKRLLQPVVAKKSKRSDDSGSSSDEKKESKEKEVVDNNDEDLIFVMDMDEEVDDYKK